LVSLMGNFTLVVAALSYAGQLNLTAVADGDSLPGRGGIRRGRPGHPQ
jgi:diacylglycerol O-acyltransferase